MPIGVASPAALLRLRLSPAAIQARNASSAAIQAAEIARLLRGLAAALRRALSGNASYARRSKPLSRKQNRLAIAKPCRGAEARH